LREYFERIYDPSSSAILAAKLVKPCRLFKHEYTVTKGFNLMQGVSIGLTINGRKKLQFTATFKIQKTKVVSKMVNH